MSFQLMDVVLYSFKGQRDGISFNLNRVNIITGASQTGKTTLIAIMDYCLGSGECHIPVGPIRHTVEWVGIRLHVAGGQVFIARRLPTSGSGGTQDIYYAVGKEVPIPDHAALRQIINLKALETLLSQHCGIRENRHTPSEGQTRHSLEANARHALLFCFQHQTEILSDKFLFHKQGEPFMPQTIRDILPYFMGATDDGHIGKMTELRELRRDLKGLERNLAEHEGIRGRGLSKAHALLSEAQDEGLYSGSFPDAWETCVQVLTQILSSTADPEEELTREGEAINRLQREREDLTQELYAIKDQLTSTAGFSAEKIAFTGEIAIQVQRLESVALFDTATPTSDKCPLCESRVQEIIPSVAELKNSLAQLSGQMRGMEERSPQMDRVSRKLQERLEDAKRRLRINREAIEAMQTANQRLQKIKDHAIRRAHITGRIALYLESAPKTGDTSGLQSRIATLKNKIAAIEDEISEESITEKLESMLSLISRDMSTWATELQVEHAGCPFRIDPKKLTLVVDTADGDGPTKMQDIGSGANWVGYHLIAHLALHRAFALKHRPVPRFLFLDQPSQAYFPADENWNSPGAKNEDREAVARMYQLAIKVSELTDATFQVIITDHADIAEDWFRKYVVRRWRGGDKKLVPIAWLTAP